MDRPLHLTDEQQLILNIAKKGHNICILGRAGVGKSTTVQEIEKALSAQGKNAKQFAQLVLHVRATAVQLKPYIPSMAFKWQNSHSKN